jgi:hypothetical protein
MALDISKLGVAGIGLDVVNWLCSNVGGIKIGKSFRQANELLVGNGWRVTQDIHKTTLYIDDEVLEIQFKLIWL